ncbi:recombinase family protein [Bradyrhizobium sp. I71]|nr:recombinase family protein [Bradyrhizobium sp. I71]
MRETLIRAEAADFKIDRVVADHGVSVISTRLAERPEGKRLFDILRSGDVLVVRWIDRLGRNYGDVCDTIREFTSAVSSPRAHAAPRPPPCRSGQRERAFGGSERRSRRGG